MTEGQRIAVETPAGGCRRGLVGLALVLAAGCGGGAAARGADAGGRAAGQGANSARAEEGGRDAAPDAARAMGLAWLAGSWRTADGRAAESWTPVGAVLVGVGFGNDGRATRSFEVMVVHDDGGRLVFTGRPNGGTGVAFQEETRGVRSITFANPGHDDPKRVDYEEVGGVLVAATEGPSGRQEWRLERVEQVAAPEIERAAAGRGDRAVQVSGASAPGDLGFSIGQDERGRHRVTIWRRDGDAGGWGAVFDLLLTG